MPPLGCCRFTHPGCNRLAHALLEGKAEGAVAPIAAVAGELLGNDGLLGCDSLAIEVDEVVDAKVVDISIVSDALTVVRVFSGLEIVDIEFQNIQDNNYPAGSQACGFLFPCAKRINSLFNSQN